MIYCFESFFNFMKNIQCDVPVAAVFLSLTIDKTGQRQGLGPKAQKAVTGIKLGHLNKIRNRKQRGRDKRLESLYEQRIRQRCTDATTAKIQSRK